MVDKLLREEQQDYLKNEPDEELIRLARAHAKQTSSMVAGILLELAYRIEEHEDSR